jgi:hypothetical protein
MGLNAGRPRGTEFLAVVWNLNDDAASEPCRQTSLRRMNPSAGNFHLSRLAGVTNGYDNAAYPYLANSPMVSTVTFRTNTTTRMTTTKTYDFLNRLTSITSVPNEAGPQTQCMRKRERGLSMNLRVLDCAGRAQRRRRFAGALQKPSPVR